MWLRSAQALFRTRYEADRSQDILRWKQRAISTSCVPAQATAKISDCYYLAAKHPVELRVLKVGRTNPALNGSFFNHFSSPPPPWVLKDTRLDTPDPPFSPPVLTGFRQTGIVPAQDRHASYPCAMQEECRLLAVPAPGVSVHSPCHSVLCHHNTQHLPLKTI